MSDEKEKVLVEAYTEGRDAYSYQEKLMSEKAFIQMKADLMFKFENTGFKDDDERREVWRKLQTIAWLDQTLTEIVNNGKIAEQELSRLGKLKQKFFKG
jgi:hypothetical protein